MPIVNPCFGKDSPEVRIVNCKKFETSVMVDDKQFAIAVEDMRMNGWHKSALIALIVQVSMWLMSSYRGCGPLVLAIFLWIYGFLVRR